MRQVLVLMICSTIIAAIVLFVHVALSSLSSRYFHSSNIVHLSERESGSNNFCSPLCNASISFVKVS